MAVAPEVVFSPIAPTTILGLAVKDGDFDANDPKAVIGRMSARNNAFRPLPQRYSPSSSTPLRTQVAACFAPAGPRFGFRPVCSLSPWLGSAGL